MKLLIFSVVTLVTVFADTCKPKYHFWRPFNGTIPKDAFLAGTDEDGRKSYVAKIIPLDQYLWTIPAQIKEGNDHVDMLWCCNDGRPYKPVMRVDKFIEILCVEDPNNLQWTKVKLYADEATSNCCLVESGIALYSNHVYIPYIGKGMVNGFNHIGRVYMERDWNGVHIMDGANSTKILEDFEVLSYDCKVDSIVDSSREIDVNGEADIEVDK